jgi:hypothetical protein
MLSVDFEVFVLFVAKIALSMDVDAYLKRINTTAHAR